MVVALPWERLLSALLLTLCFLAAVAMFIDGDARKSAIAASIELKLCRYRVFQRVFAIYDTKTKV